MLHTKKVPVTTTAFHSISHVLYVTLDGFSANQCFLFNGQARVFHRLDPRDALQRDGAARLSATVLELAGLGALIRRATDTEHLVVGELDDHLRVGIGRKAEALYQVLAVTIVCKHMLLVRRNQIVKTSTCRLDGLVQVVVEVEL